MEFPRFKLDEWLNRHDGAEFDLGTTTGPTLTTRELLAMGGGGSAAELLDMVQSYTPARGGERVRAAIAAQYNVDPAAIQLTTGASEALLMLFALVSSPGANVIVPAPSFPTVHALADGFNIERRLYHLRPEHGFTPDRDEILALIDRDTRMLVVNSPHNPTGACISNAAMRDLHDICTGRGIWFVSDEVYHPLYYGPETASAAALPGAIVLSSCSKVFSLSGLRLGWIVDGNPERRAQYWRARAYFTISCSAIAERLAEIALQHADALIERSRATGRRNLSMLDAFFADHADLFQWVRPQGGTVCFPWLASGEDARPLCEELTRRGVLLVPGDCFAMPAHMRLGFGAAGEGLTEALSRISETVASLPRA